MHTLDRGEVMAKRDDHLTRALVVAPDDLRRLNNIVKAMLGDVEYEISCSDHIKRDFADLDALLAYDNPPSRRIMAIRLSRLHSFNKSFQLKLDTTPSNVFISINGDEETVSKLSEAVEDRLAAMKPWYSFLVRADFLVFGILLYFAAHLALLVAATTGVFGPAADAPSQSTLRGTATGGLIVIGIIAAILVIGGLLNSLRARLFPLAVFLVGQGDQRHRHLEMIRQSVVIGAAVSLITGFILTLWR